MKIKAITYLLAITCTAPAYSGELLLGNFGHKYTSDNKATVWSIRTQGRDYELLTSGDNSKTKLKSLSKAEITALWDKLLWPSTTIQGVSCLGNKDEIFCHIPTEQRKKITWLTENTSDFLHYSSMGGVMEIKKN